MPLWGALVLIWHCKYIIINTPNLLDACLVAKIPKRNNAQHHKYRWNHFCFQKSTATVILRCCSVLYCYIIWECQYVDSHVLVSGTAELKSTLQVVPNDNCQSQRCKDGTIVQRYIDIERRYMAKYYLKFSVYLNLNKWKWNMWLHIMLTLIIFQNSKIARGASASIAILANDC